jgi:hypothetical protein
MKYIETPQAQIKNDNKSLCMLAIQILTAFLYICNKIYINNESCRCIEFDAKSWRCSAERHSQLYLMFKILESVSVLMLALWLVLIKPTSSAVLKGCMTAMLYSLETSGYIEERFLSLRETSWTRLGDKRIYYEMDRWTTRTFKHLLKIIKISHIHVLRMTAMLYSLETSGYIEERFLSLWPTDWNSSFKWVKDLLSEEDKICINSCHGEKLNEDGRQMHLLRNRLVEKLII